ncbi:MAG: UDP-N-acetylmuramoyl-L-alanyl-D-glutamate--2,6-diaminopimelate ligase [Lysobacteraceae bacterium]
MSAMALSALLDGFAAVPAAHDLRVTGLSVDSRAVHAGDAFFAMAGASAHGLRFVPQVLDAGAAAIVFDAPAPIRIDVPASAIGVAGLRNALGAIADRFYGSPSHALVLVGVTGTNGKTSTVQLLAQAFSLHGEIAGSIGTLGAGLHGNLIAGERTTPDVIAVHRLLAEMREAGATHVAMEVSSHALDQGRVDAVAFDVAVFTNLSRDHLDYHADMDAYFAAKARLFANANLRAAVLNLDDAAGERLKSEIGTAVRSIGLSSRGNSHALLQADAVELDAAGIAFDLLHDGVRRPIRSPLLGRFNVDNLLAVAGVLLALDWPLTTIAAMLPRLQPVSGRMNRIGGGCDAKGRQQPLVVIDYAHTPDALEQSLSGLRSHTRGALVCVFGCGGERDRGKRPQMAEVAERLADRVIVTDDNPRGESGDAIVAEISKGFANAGAVRVQRDRALAIVEAIAGAEPDDVVLIAGKGHESYQESGGVRRAFDDLQHARQALAQRGVEP